MTIMPDFLHPIIHSYLDILLLWFSDYVYQQLLPLYQNHPLLRLHELLDLSPLETGYQEFINRMVRGVP